MDWDGDVDGFEDLGWHVWVVSWAWEEGSVVVHTFMIR